MNNFDHRQPGQTDTYIAQLKEQFERIDQIIESGGTVKLDLNEGDRSISMIIDRNNVVESASPLGRSPHQTRSRLGNENLDAPSIDTFSFDVGYINRQVGTDAIEAQLSKASDVQAEARARMRSMTLNDAAPSGVPNPAVRYVGDVWVIAEDCAYTTNDGFRITVKSGFKTDLASIPRIFWALIASFELSVPAPVFHDLIYRSAGEVAPPDGEVAPAGKVFTRQEADDIFLELMTRSKVSYWKRNVAYLAVRNFAEYAWRKLRLD